MALAPVAPVPARLPERAAAPLPARHQAAVVQRAVSRRWLGPGRPQRRGRNTSDGARPARREAHAAGRRTDGRPPGSTDRARAAAPRRKAGDSAVRLSDRARQSWTAAFSFAIA